MIDVTIEPDPSRAETVIVVRIDDVSAAESCYTLAERIALALHEHDERLMAAAGARHKARVEAAARDAEHGLTLCLDTGGLALCDEHGRLTVYTP